MYNAGLILEGGGMRGVYTTGVLDFFLDKQIEFTSCYGVSAGACHACSYLSKQRGRSFSTNVDFLKDKRYCSVHSLVTTGDLFGADMLYDIIPNQLIPYDYQTFDNNKCRFYAVATNCRTGEAEYFPVKEMHKDIIAVRASSSLPLLARRVVINDEEYLDGGIADSIPLKKSIQDGNVKNVLVLTRDASYRKKPNRLARIIRLKFTDCPELIKKLENRHERYNETLDFIQQEQEKGRAFVIRPRKAVHIGLVEKDRRKLEALYNEGYNDAKDAYPELMKFLEQS
ncbi:MAG TPA: patatin family protein [Firmicutes bacterium]|mgnify:FL=1|nr:patatin family protein [Bacillota bacterium]